MSSRGERRREQREAEAPARRVVVCVLWLEPSVDTVSLAVWRERRRLDGLPNGYGATALALWPPAEAPYTLDLIERLLDSSRLPPGASAELRRSIAVVREHLVAEDEGLVLVGMRSVTT
jgi:hypothetical protein